MRTKFDPDKHPQTMAMESLVSRWISKFFAKPITMLDLSGPAFIHRASQYLPVAKKYIAVERDVYTFCKMRASLTQDLTKVWGDDVEVRYGDFWDALVEVNPDVAKFCATGFLSGLMPQIRHGIALLAGLKRPGDRVAFIVRWNRRRDGVEADKRNIRLIARALGKHFSVTTERLPDHGNPRRHQANMGTVCFAAVRK